MENECIFCKIINKEINAEIVYEDNDMLAFKDINPQAPVHIVFIPKQHIETNNDISEGNSGIVGNIFCKIKDIAIANGLEANGYRVVSNCNKDAGQEVFHLHFHLLGGRKFTWPPG
jgi:histidine triad (HIT) family protein